MYCRSANLLLFCATKVALCGKYFRDIYSFICSLIYNIKIVTFMMYHWIKIQSHNQFVAVTMQGSTVGSAPLHFPNWDVFIAGVTTKTAHLHHTWCVWRNIYFHTTPQIWILYLLSWQAIHRRRSQWKVRKLWRVRMSLHRDRCCP